MSEASSYSDSPNSLSLSGAPVQPGFVSNRVSHVPLPLKGMLCGQMVSGRTRKGDGLAVWILLCVLLMAALLGCRDIESDDQPSASALDRANGPTIERIRSFGAEVVESNRTDKASLRTTSVSLSGGENVPKELFQSIRRLSGDVELAVNFASVSSQSLSCLSGMSNLRTFCLGDTRVVGGELSTLRGLTGLRLATVRHPQIRDADLAFLDDATELQELHLNGSGITDASLARIARLKELRLLDISDTAITDHGLDQLSGHPSIEVLSLGNTKVTDAGMPFIPTLSRLKRLSLNDTAISDKGLHYLVGVKRLSILYVSNSRITAAGLSSLRPLRDLWHVEAWNNGITPSAAAESLPGVNVYCSRD